MKKTICRIATLLLLCAIIFGIVGCNFSYSFEDEEEHDVILVLIKNDGTKIRKVLTSRRSGVDIYEPCDYKVYPSLISGYVVVGDVWYESESSTSTMYFPCTMPDNDLELYANIRPLTDLSNVNFADSVSVHDYFSLNATLYDEYYWNTPSENNETSYYEVSETINLFKNIIRYYPATQKIMLIRGFSKNQIIADSIYFQDEFTLGICINLMDKSFTCKGIYSRTGASSQSVSGGSVTITYSLDKISIDDPNQPLLPNFESIKYTYTITNATNQSKMQELWDKDGHDYAKNCYSQSKSLLKSISNRIQIFC